MRNVLAAGLIGLGSMYAGLGDAKADPVVVELFTSQGCSSCPPADAILGQLAGRDDVIALSLHVDYWDYLGWKDSFADPRFTERQKGYASASKSTMIYTPQAVIGGIDHLVGSNGMEVMDKIMTHKAREERVALTLSRRDDNLRITARMTGTAPQSMVVQLIRYTPLVDVDIQRGELAGHVLQYHNVVRAWGVLGNWDGQAPLDMTAPVKGREPAVVVIQDGVSGPVLAAARVD